MVEDPKKYLDNLNSAMGRFAKVDKDTLSGHSSSCSDSGLSDICSKR
jgi:hypothetical protein